MKRPDGFVLEEFVTVTSHFFENGKLQFHDNETERGEYTGRFCFEYRDGGKTTKWYTQENAPKWLLKLYLEATGAAT